MMVIRSSRVSANGTPDSGPDADPLQEQAAEVFAEQLVENRVPPVRAIRAQLHVGQPRAQRLREYLDARTERLAKNSLCSERSACLRDLCVE